MYLDDSVTHQPVAHAVPHLTDAATGDHLGPAMPAMVKREV
jgi:hypothetical protein